MPITRRTFLKSAAAATLISPFVRAYVPSPTEVPAGDRPPQDKSVEILHPRARVPLSFIIDDSTCLVNMGAFCMPQFHAAWPQNPIYWKKWKDWPREIPDSFVREFGEFCAQQGVRGKYSLVPYPACVGWLDRDLPGWSRKDLADSLKLVRELMVPNWDITPEMITHTRVIDLKTGRPFPDFTPATMENSYPPRRISTDEMAAYVAYALRILKNAEIPCTGITTPGGFGNAAKAELSLGVRQALADVYAPEVPFYFKYVADGNESTEPRLEHVEAANTDSPKFIVNVPSACGDWFGNWDGDGLPQPDKYITADATAGRMVELIDRGQPAIMFGHWAGLFSNGSKRGFAACQQVITTLNQKYRDKTLWMKNSEIARYAAARELTKIERQPNRISLTAPIACSAFTLRVNTSAIPSLQSSAAPIALSETTTLTDLKPGTWHRQGDQTTICFDLPKGITTLVV